MPTPENGIITRVRMDAEASDLGDCQRALNQGYSVIHAALIRAIEQQSFGSADPLAAASVFPRESEFVEEVFESKIRRDGSIYYVGRRVISFENPVEGFELPTALELGETMMPGGLLLADDERLRRLELDARVERVDVDRAQNGVWFLAVQLDTSGPAAHLLEQPGGGYLAQVSGQGASLSAAIVQVEQQLYTDEPPRVGGPGRPPAAVQELRVDPERTGDGRLVKFHIVIPGEAFPYVEVWVAPSVTIWRAAEIACEQEGLVWASDWQIRASDGSLVFHGEVVAALDLSQSFSFGSPR